MDLGNLFFTWDRVACHQVGLYYLVALVNETQIQLEGSFFGQDWLDGKTVDLEYSWVEQSALNQIELYPINAKERLMRISQGIEHFVDKK